MGSKFRVTGKLAITVAFLGACIANAPVMADVPAIQYGAPVSGVCFLSRATAIGNSRAGKQATLRMQQLLGSVKAELNPEQQAIRQETTALQNGRSTMAAAQFQQRSSQLAARISNLQRLDQLRGAQLERTRLLAEQTIANAIPAALAVVVPARRCSFVMERGVSYGFNEAMDITPFVVQQIDKTLPGIQLDLVQPGSSQTR